jgi:hypothetical protein
MSMRNLLRPDSQIISPVSELEKAERAEWKSSAKEGVDLPGGAARAHEDQLGP